MFRNSVLTCSRNYFDALRRKFYWNSIVEQKVNLVRNVYCVWFVMSFWTSIYTVWSFPLPTFSVNITKPQGKFFYAMIIVPLKRNRKRFPLFRKFVCIENRLMYIEKLSESILHSTSLCMLKMWFYWRNYKRQCILC